MNPVHPSPATPNADLPAAVGAPPATAPIRTRARLRAWRDRAARRVVRILRRCAAIAGLAVTLVPTLAAASGQSTARYTIRDHGAVGDGVALDTAAINDAVAAAGAAGGGTVEFPPGRYLSGTIHLRSRVTLLFAAGARLIGTTNLAEYHHPTPPAFMPEARWGKWHRGLIVGEGVEQVTLLGPGVIDGNKVFDPAGEERMRGPHGIVLVDCRQVTVRDLTIVDAANYAVYFEVSDEVEFRDVTMVGGWDGIHWRGAPERWCHGVRIVNCQFFTGDDAIAGRYWDNTVISGCVINSSCNGLRLIGPARRLVVNDCLIYGPGEQPHRTSGERRRTNMLAGIILQPGAWDATRGELDEVLLAKLTLRDVAAPVAVWTKPGNTVGRITVTDLDATGVYRAALSVESWSDAPIGEVVLRGLRVEFAGDGRPEQAAATVQPPGVDVRALPAWGLYARNVGRLTVEDVRLSLAKDDLRPALMAEDVGELTLDNLRVPTVEGVAEPMSLRRVRTVNRR